MEYTTEELLEYKRKAENSTVYDTSFYVLARELVPKLIDELLWYREGQGE